MLHPAKVFLCSEIHTKHVSVFCRQNVELLNVKPEYSYSFKRLKILTCELLIDNNLLEIELSNKTIVMTFHKLFLHFSKKK